MKRQRVLMATGESPASSELASVLRGIGYDVVIPDDLSRDSIQRSVRDRPEIAFIDLTGEILAESRAVAAQIEEHDMPVIAIVPRESVSLPQAPKEIHVYGHIVRPFDSSTLKTVIDLATGRQSAEKALRRSKEDLRKYRVHLEAVLSQRTKELKKTNAQIHRLLRYVEMTDRKLATDSLGAELHRPADIGAPEIGEGVITADPGMRVVLMNAAASQILGITEDEAVGKAIGEVFGVSDTGAATRIADSMKDMLVAGTPGEALENVRIMTRPGEKRILSAYYEPIFDSDDSIAGIVLTFRNASENRRREYEAIRSRRLETLSLMARGLAHDLNNMLSSVLANIQLARVDLPCGTSGHDRLDCAEDAVFRARELSQQLLVSSERKESPMKILDLAGLIRKTGLFSTRGSQSRVEFSFPGELAEVAVDEDIIRLILSDLFLFLDNSVPEGGPITVTAENIPPESAMDIAEPRERVIIRLDAAGLETSDETRSRIFQAGSCPAFAVDLSFAESLARRYGGVLEVRKGDGQGTGFDLILPGRSAAPVSPGRQEPDILAAGKEQSKKILLMDDEDAILSATSEMLKFLGYEVVTASNGEAAVEIHRRAITAKAPFDAVILDITVPGGLGAKETLPMLTASDPGIRAIISSGYSTNPMITGYRSFGFGAAIVKPYGFRELQQALGQVFPPGA